MNNNTTTQIPFIHPTQIVSFDQPLLQVEGLKTKFDLTMASASLTIAVGDYDQAIMLQRLHYWSLEYGTILDGIKWIWKTYKEFKQEVFPEWTVWKIRKTLGGLIEKGLIRKQELHRKHFGDRWMQRRIRTSYYRLVPEKLEELALKKLEKVNKAQTHTESSFVSSAEQFCEYPQNRSETTNQKIHPDQIPPLPPKLKSQGGEEKNSINSQDPTRASEIFTSSQQSSKLTGETDKPKPKIKKPRRVVHYREKIQQEEAAITFAPWRSPQELQLFYAALVEALPRVENAYSPQGLAKKIIKDIEAGLPCPYWDDFEQGREIGASSKKEWERQPGVPYAEFMEFVIQETRGMYDNKAQESNSAAEIRVKKELRKPQEAKRLWECFKGHIVRVGEEIKKMEALGVRDQALPAWARKLEPEAIVELAESIGHEFTAATEQLSQTEPDYSQELEVKVEPEEPVTTSLRDSLTPEQQKFYDRMKAKSRKSP